LLPWQCWLLIHMLELNEDGTFRFRTVLILVARQNGKTLLMQVVSLWRMYVDGAALIIGTAQNLDVAEEAWEKTVELAQDTADLAVEIKHVDRTNGKKALRLQTGERYKVAASSRRGGRGLSSELAMLDELREHRTWQAWSAVSKTTLAKRNAQIVATSNAGDSESVVLAHLRARALDAIARGNEATTLAIFEWSAPEDAAIDDRAGAWVPANPSLGHPGMITEEAIASALETDPEEEFKTEVLCQWSDKAITPSLPLDDWDECLNEASLLAGAIIFAADINPRRTHASIAAAGVSTESDDGDPLWHVEITKTGPGTDWLLDELARLAGEYNAEVYIDPASPAGSLIAPLLKLGVKVETIQSGREFAQACSQFHDAVTAHELVHIGQEQLDDAVIQARTRPLGETWAFTHKGVEGDITPLIAGVIALAGAQKIEDNDYDVAESFG